MKGAITIALFLVAIGSAYAQVFIGCKEDNKWVEAPMLRKEFFITEGEMRQSQNQRVNYGIDVVSLGHHEVYVNGTKVGDKVMQPAVSQLDKHALQVSYEISDLIHEGVNEIKIWLGQGWGRLYGTPAVAKATVSKSVSDGECGLIFNLFVTDSSWDATPSGYSYTGSWQPMQFGGERLDRRVPSRWRHATAYSNDGIKITQQEFKGNAIVDTLPIASQEKEADGSILIDFGRVVTGWFNASFAPMQANAEVTMEYLDHRDAKPPFTESDIYISDGKGHDVFCNKFHIHAFRYVRIKGAVPASARAFHISAVNPQGGASFECSDPRLNAIHNMVKYTLSCLTHSGYMVDCPHIERMGYGGDGNSSTMALQTLWDVGDTYLNWLTAWSDAMDSTGDLPYVAPAFRTGGGPYWSGFIIKAPWRTYQNYSDPTLIYRHYDEMRRWIDYVEKHFVDGILTPWVDTERRSWFLGDWLAPEGVETGGESILHVSNCFISECLGDMIEMAAMTDNKADISRFKKMRKQLNKAIHRHFYHPESHTYANGTPIDQCYALLMDIPPDAKTAKAVKEQLIHDCHIKYKDHIAAGLVGVPLLTEWCIRERETSLMATILRQGDYPGYLRMIEHGEQPRGGTYIATTWESWDCGRAGKEDRSRVHNCYNGIAIWFYQALAGIRPDSANAGYKHFFIDPQPVEGIKWVHATKPTPYGTIEVNIEGRQMKVVVPQGTSATVFPNSKHERNVEAGEWRFTISDR